MYACDVNSIEKKKEKKCRANLKVLVKLEVMLKEVELRLFFYFLTNLIHQWVLEARKKVQVVRHWVLIEPKRQF